MRLPQFTGEQMRRREKEIAERQAIDAIINKCQVLRLGLSRDDVPYIVPLSFGYDGNSFFFHTAAVGLKLDILAVNPKVCFELEHGVSLKTDPDSACEWSFSYQSVIGHGRVEELVASGEKHDALVQIMRQYDPGTWSFTPAQLSGIKVWQLKIDSITGKQS